MEVKVEDINAVTKKLAITLAADAVSAAYDAAMRKVSRQAQVPGFRPGKMPRALLQRQYGPAIVEEAQSQLLDQSLTQAVQEAKLEPVTMPRVELAAPLQRGVALTYTALVEVRPQIVLNKYEGLEAPPEFDGKVDEADIEAELQRLRHENSDVQPVTDRHEVGATDLVQIDFEGFVEGTAFPGGKGENTLLDIAKSDFIPGFAEQLVGATVPGQRDIVVTFPDDYHSDELSGKEATFKVQLRELKSRHLPALDDEFAKDVGEESLEALKKSVHERLVDRLKSERHQQRRTGVLKSLLAHNPLEVPPSMVARQTEQIVSDTIVRFERMMNMKLNAEQIGGLRRSSSQDAEFQVQCGLLLLEVAKAANLMVTEQEVNAEVKRLAAQAGEHAEQFLIMYADPERHSDLQSSMLEERTIAHLLAHAVDAPLAAATPAP